MTRRVKQNLKANQVQKLSKIVKQNPENARRPCGTRTHDSLIKSQVLCHLS